MEQSASNQKCFKQGHYRLKSLLEISDVNYFSFEKSV